MHHANGWAVWLAMASGAHARTTGAGGGALYLVVNRPIRWGRGSVSWGSPSARSSLQARLLKGNSMHASLYVLPLLP